MLLPLGQHCVKQLEYPKGPTSSATEERFRDTESKSVVGVAQGDFGESVLVRKDHHWLKRLDRKAR